MNTRMAQLNSRFYKKLTKAELPDWAQAGCRGLYNDDVFFPERGIRKSINIARKICNECPIRAQCLKYALDNEIEHGIWGGTTPDERFDILRK